MGCFLEKKNSNRKMATLGLHFTGQQPAKVERQLLILPVPLARPYLHRQPRGKGDLLSYTWPALLVYNTSLAPCSIGIRNLWSKIKQDDDTGWMIRNKQSRNG